MSPATTHGKGKNPHLSFFVTFKSLKEYLHKDSNPLSFCKETASALHPPVSQGEPGVSSFPKKHQAFIHMPKLQQCSFPKLPKRFLWWNTHPAVISPSFSSGCRCSSSGRRGFSSRDVAALSRLSQNLISGQFTASSKHTAKIINTLLCMISLCHTRPNATRHPQISSFSYYLLFSAGLNLKTWMCKQRAGQTQTHLSSQQIQGGLPRFADSTEQTSDVMMLLQ